MNILEKIKKFKKEVEDIKEFDGKYQKVNKGALCKVLVMVNMAEMCILSKTIVPIKDRDYFEGQTVVGRYFSDWGLDWIAMDYLEICSYIKSHNWEKVDD